jgi:hypothetical protein
VKAAAATKAQKASEMAAAVATPAAAELVANASEPDATAEPTAAGVESELRAAEDVESAGQAALEQS